jgi:DNA polymerase delta subunit 1
VCDHFFGSTKDDVTYADIVGAWTSKDPMKLGVIAKYCMQDSYLVLQLAHKVKQIFNSIAMSQLTKVPLAYIINRGQQIKCYSLLLNEIYGEFVCNYVPKPIKIKKGNDDESDEEDTYQGATVIDAKKGYYNRDKIIVTLDFASLYPSIMRWKDLCYSTYASLLPPEEIEMYEKNENVTVQRFKIDDAHQEIFIRNKTRSGILAQIETRLGLARKATRKLMVGETDKFVLALLDGKQLSEKLVMNALYGFCGANMGMLPMKAIAATITAVGRDTIMLTKDHLETNHDCQVVYGGMFDYIYMT